MELKILLDRLYYGYEDSYDISRDVEEALEVLVGEWGGTVKVTISYDPTEPADD